MKNSLGRRLAAVHTATEHDTRERIKALRLQTEAWRLLAVIATYDPAYAVKKARWLFFVSVPCVEEASVQRFIDEHRSMADDYGHRSGVFDRPVTRKEQHT